MGQDQSLSVDWRGRARRFRLLLIGVLIAAGLTTLLVQWVDLAALRHVSPGFAGRLLHSEHATWIAWVTQWATSFAVLVAIVRILHMLRIVAEGDPFSRAITADLRSFAFWVFVATIASVLIPVSAVFIARVLAHVRVDDAVEISGSDLLLLLMTAILHQVVRLLDVARVMADDYRQII